MAARTELDWPTGPSLRLGFAYSRTATRHTGEHHQLMPSLGLAWLAADWRLEAGYTAAWAARVKDSFDALDMHVASLEGGGQLGALGIGLQLATLASSERGHFQLSPSLSWGRPTDLFSASLRAWGTWWPISSEDEGEPLRAAVGLSLSLRPAAALAITAGGWYGRRKEHVEAGDGWFWNTDDVFEGGWEAGLALSLAADWSLHLRFTHDFGVAQGTEVFDFHLFKAHLGLSLEL